jgi:hypothetical protein
MSFFESMPLSVFDGRADKEVIPTGLPTPIAPASGDVMGDEANHSSQTASVDMSQGVQWDDDESAGGYAPNTSYDPNISGPRQTEEVKDARAGMMNGFCENNDYMRFSFDTSMEPESRLCYGASTGMAPWTNSFEDNQDMPVPPMHDFTPEQEFEFGSDSVSPQGSFSHSGATIAGIPIYPVVRR